VPSLELHTAIGRAQVGLLADVAEPSARAGEIVLLTSGTSGFSCGCVFTVDALLRNAARHAESVGQGPEDVVLVSLPLHFSYAMVAQALATLATGGRLVVSGPPFHVGSYLDALESYGVTVSSLTPSLVRPLLQSSPAIPSRLRVLTVGGDVLPAEQVEDLLRRRPGGELYLTYGLTQAGPRVSTLAAHREPPSRHTSVGLPLRGTRVWLEDVGAEVAGAQLFVASDTVMHRRLGLSEGRRDEAMPSPGVVATGDLFEQDAEGYLYFRGRLSDFIVRRGEKICLAAVRRVASELPGVAAARTHVVEREHDGVDYFLTLLTEGATSLGVDDYGAILRRRLCRSELPSGIEIVRESGDRLPYK
jgi:acyl-CoA synthetase (AMP-forming)/AMP-acid ligase II